MGKENFMHTKNQSQMIFQIRWITIHRQYSKLVTILKQRISELQLFSLSLLRISLSLSFTAASIWLYEHSLRIIFAQWSNPTPHVIQTWMLSICHVANIEKEHNPAVNLVTWNALKELGNLEGGLCIIRVQLETFFRKLKKIVNMFQFSRKYF